MMFGHQKETLKPSNIQTTDILVALALTDVLMVNQHMLWYFYSLLLQL